MQSDFLVLGSDQVVHNVRPRRVASRVAEPTLTDVAVDLRIRISSDIGFAVRGEASRRRLITLIRNDQLRKNLICS